MYMYIYIYIYVCIYIYIYIFMSCCFVCLASCMHVITSCFRQLVFSFCRAFPHRSLSFYLHHLSLQLDVISRCDLSHPSLGVPRFPSGHAPSRRRAARRCSQANLSPLSFTEWLIHVGRSEWLAWLRISGGPGPKALAFSIFPSTGANYFPEFTHV